MRRCAGSTDSAKRPLASVYSRPQYISVSSGRVRRALSPSHIGPGFPSIIAAAAHGEQRIADKDVAVDAVVVGDVPQRVAGRSDDVEDGGTEREDVAAFHHDIEPEDLFDLGARASDGDVEIGPEHRQSFDMVAVVMGNEDVGEGPAAMVKGGDDRSRRRAHRLKPCAGYLYHGRERRNCRRGRGRRSTRTLTRLLGAGRSWRLSSAAGRAMP